jgi:fibronectin-binding autotransporter adhesin
MALPNLLSSYNFPNAYDDLVDAFTGTIKYISASTGSNSNTGNSVSAAYLTIDYAFAQNTSATATMFVILEGTYTLTPTSVNGSSVGLTDGGNHREFVCAPGRVIIQHTASGGDRDSAIFHFANTNSKIYGAIIKRNNSARTTNYTVAYFRMGSAKGNIYNSVFSEVNTNNAWSYQYDNDGLNNIALRNCTFYNLAAPASNYTNAGTCLTIDSVFNTTVTTGGTETNVLKSQTVNATTYVTTGVTTAGVYSGTYAWNGTTTTPDPGFTTASASVSSGTTIALTYFHTTSSATVPYTISGVTSADINGASLTGNLSVSNSFATLSITTIGKLATTNTLTVTAGAYSISVTITPSFTCEILIVAGGGSGGNHSTTNANGGGGAGGVLRGTASLGSGNYAVTVGGGGSAIANSTALNGVKGSNSSLGSYVAEGGGGGGSTGVAFSSASQNGGSGGGNAYGQTGGGSANVNATAGSLSVLGNNGGSTSTTWTGAGGGGAGAAGVNGSGSSPGGNGGIGITNTWTGSTLYLAGGGGGSGNSSERAGDGFYGGGRGAGTTTYYSYNVYTNEVNATTFGSGIPTAVVNSGGGGGAGSYWAPNGGWSTGSGAGGSGRVLVRYAGTPKASGGTITQSGGYTIHQFLTAGTFTTPTPGLTSSHTTTAYWGETITFTYLADVADASTEAYTISGVTSGQINGASLTGNFTFSGSLATVTVTLSAQSTNTTATMTFVSGATTITIQISNVVSFTSSVAGTYWGGTTTLTATVRGLTAGGTVPYAISGVTSAQISNTSLTGSLSTVLAVYGYSASFNGTTSKLSIPASADFAFGTGNFTIEFWIKTTDAAFEITTQTTTSSPNWGLVVTGGSLYWQNGFAAASLYSLGLTSMTANPTSGSWTHVAITRNGTGVGGLRFWINGVGQTAHSSTDATNYTGQGPIQISGPGTSYGFFAGNISNFRIVKGVAVYTGNFTVPTTALTATQSSGTNISAITGTQTSLLCCQSATLIDNSAATRTITNTAVTVSEDAPFGNNALAAVAGGIAALVVVTNPLEPILNSATMVATAAGISRSITIRTGNPRLSQNASTGIQTLVYVDTEITDIHSEGLEAKLDNLPTVNSVIESNKLVTNLNGFVAAPTYAYSSGEEIVTQEQGAATISQVWTLS